MYKYIIFDFDGVIAESNSVRLEGFKELFKDHSQEDIDAIIDFSIKNGGTSRYERIRYFYEEHKGTTADASLVQQKAGEYSAIVKQGVVDSPSVIGATEFLKQHHSQYTFAIVSGSDQAELRDICHARGIKHYFVEILGSPVEKQTNLAELLSQKKWQTSECCYVGDAITDYRAAQYVGIDFLARDSNTTDWNKLPEVSCMKNLLELPAILNRRVEGQNP